MSDEILKSVSSSLPSNQPAFSTSPPLLLLFQRLESPLMAWLCWRHWLGIRSAHFVQRCRRQRRRRCRRQRRRRLFLRRKKASREVQRPMKSTRVLIYHYLWYIFCINFLSVQIAKGSLGLVSPVGFEDIQQLLEAWASAEPGRSLPRWAG